MAKFCTNCGKELDENAAMCLNCGVLVGNSNSNNNNVKNEKKKGLPTWAIVLIVVGCFTILPIIIMVVIAVTAYNVISDTGIDVDNFIEEILIQEGTIGDTLRTDEFKITLTEALMYDSIGSDEYYVDTPADGKEFLVFFFNVENISDESQYISSYDFDGYVDGYTVSTKYLMNDIDGVEELGADLMPSTKTKGFVAFEIDQTWQEFEIRFSEWYDEEELVFRVVNETSNSIEGA